MVDIPEHLLKRAQERRKQLGLPAEGEEGAEAPAAEGPEGEAAAPAEGEAAPAAAAAETPAPAGGGGAFEDMSKKSGVPAHLLERAARRKAQLTGEPMPGEGGAAPAAAAAAATAVAVAPVAAGTGPAGHTHRLLTVVKSGSIQQTKASPVDKVHTWPHLLVFEFTALLTLTAMLIVFSALVRAPLLELADFNRTPNPSKAPWYFLGLQEMLTMFHPMVAGVLVPGFGLVGLGAAPYIDKNPSNEPSARKFAIVIFTLFVVASAILAIIGSFFRGPGFNFTWPWSQGIFFDL